MVDKSRRGEEVVIVSPGTGEPEQEPVIVWVTATIVGEDRWRTYWNPQALIDWHKENDDE